MSEVVGAELQLVAVGGRLSLHPSLGPLELSCQIVQDPFQSHALLVHTATPGTASHLLGAVEAPRA